MACYRWPCAIDFYPCSACAVHSYVGIYVHAALRRYGDARMTRNDTIEEVAVMLALRSFVFIDRIAAQNALVLTLPGYDR